MFVLDEEDHETLLLHRISADDIYRKQEGISALSFSQSLSKLKCCVHCFDLIILFELSKDTIISWRDQEFSAELALSFQESTGCSYIW